MYRMQSNPPRFLLGLVVVSLMAVSANAQDVRYKTESKTDVHALGFLGGLFNQEVKEEIFIKEYKMRADRKNQSTITDLDAERIINVDHKKKEYSIITFAEMIEMMNSLGSQAEEAATPDAPAGEAPEYEVEFDLRVEETGKTKKIDKYDTSQRVMILETKIKPKDATADDAPSGAMYSVTDLWVADAIPEMEAAHAFQQRMAEIMSGSLASMDMAGVIDKLLGSYPQIGAAIERSKEELAKVDGFPLASTMHLVTVPSDMDLDLALVLGEKKKEKKGGGFGGFLKKMAESQGMPAGDEAEAKPEQKTLLSVHSSTSSISNKSQKPSYFDVPPGYDEVEYRSPMKDMEKN